MRISDWSSDVCSSDLASHLSGCQPYDGCYIWAIAAALAGGAGEPGNEEQNRKVAARMNQMIYRGVNGVTRFIPQAQGAYAYPDQTAHPAPGQPHQFMQSPVPTLTPANNGHPPS